MHNKHSVNTLEKRLLGLALFEVLKLWSNKLYVPFLQQSKPDKLTDNWFKRFVADWKVARTIKGDKMERVREYLDNDFRKMLLKGDEGAIVDDAAKYIQQEKWGSQMQRNGKGSLPISIVSKVGFFFCPAKLVPRDGLAWKGLNKLRRGDDEPQMRGPSYSEYLKAFNEQYTKYESQLSTALNKQWLIDLANELGCPTSALTTIAMRRKLFDNYLMELALEGETQNSEKIVR